jgi:D-glucosaminate-6-phosphate ammonia-lyase
MFISCVEMVNIYNPYEKYGIRRVINGATCLTRLGGSISHPEVFSAMQDASKSFVQIPELQAWAGKKIAEATGAEAGLPTAGANNALMLAAAACIMKNTELEQYDPLEPETWSHIALRVPAHLEGLPTEFIVQKNNRFIYDHAVECVGGQFIEVGHHNGATEKELREAYNPEKTAAYYYTVRSATDCLPLETVVKIAHKHCLPVIVDAAAELPPRMKLTQYIGLGADLVIFSGGKYLGGPNNSGILAGRKDLIKLAHLQAYPFHGVGRASKMSRETIVGFVKALEIYLGKDEKGEFDKWVVKAERMVEQLGKIAGVSTGVIYHKTIEEDMPMAPLCYLELDEEKFDIGAKKVVTTLRDGDPSIEILHEPSFLLEKCEGIIVINPEFMIEGDVEIVIDRITKLLHKHWCACMKS